jgi:hypothetical protein
MADAGRPRLVLSCEMMPLRKAVVCVLSAAKSAYTKLAGIANRKAA